jgi:hypothetical protein
MPRTATGCRGGGGGWRGDEEGRREEGGGGLKEAAIVDGWMACVARATGREERSHHSSVWRGCRRRRGSPVLVALRANS